ncbi:GntR family transcriptional regulator [Aureimonas populi]|uniref:GntR family transcriptional regulator n=1 Tax=Aureimonas populi TaxID=1701758 RepID=A0ABW5CP59_9HYPH|nr:GntR family transcriptional regulator [Aureimonas populi]
MSLAKQFNTRPLYQQVADEFISRIVSRQWAPGQSIENEADLARSLGISLGTVRKAFDILSEHRLLDRQQGRGTTVADLDSASANGRFSNIRDLQGRRIRGDVEVGAVSLALPTPRVAAALGVNGRTPLVRFERQRFHHGRCFMVEEVHLRADASAHNASPQDLRRIALERWQGQDLATRKCETVGAAPAEERDVAIFGIGRMGAVLTLERVIYSYQERPLELRIARCHLGDDLTYGAT